MAAVVTNEEFEKIIEGVLACLQSKYYIDFKKKERQIDIS